MSEGLYDLLVPAEPPGSDRIFGVVVAIVTNTKDPENRGRVRLRFPWLGPDAQSAWARVATPMAGNNRGVWLPPEVEDEVLVAFEQGHAGFPVVIGALWNGKDKPPADTAHGKNDVQMIKSRSGHVIRLTDKDGAEKIEIIDRSGKNRIEIDTKADTVTIAAEANVIVKATNGRLALQGKTVEIEATGGDATVKAHGGMTLKGDAAVTIKGRTVDIN